MRGYIQGGLCGLVAFVAAGPAAANDISFPSGVTGDWGGQRTALRDQGWQFLARGVFEGAFNPAGGDHQAIAGAGETDFGALADLGKLVGDKDATLEIKITDRYGANLVTAAGLHTLMQVQEIWGRSDIWRLTQMSLDQKLFQDKVDMELGRLNPGGDFDLFSCDFENLNFCGAPAGNIDGDYWFNSPVSQWGGRAKLDVTSSVNAEAGVYQINPKNLNRGFSFDFSSGAGALVPYEIEWKPSLLQDLPGDYQIGGWYSTANADDTFRDIHGAAASVTGAAPMIDHGRSGFFLSASQQITGEAPSKDAPAGSYGKGLTFFFNYTQSDRSTSRLDNQFALGAVYKGAIPSRSDDEIALALGATHVNGRIAMGEQLQDTASLSQMPVQHTEYVGELDYRLFLTPGVELTPNLQYVTDPGGVDGRPDVVVLGLKGSLSL